LRIGSSYLHLVSAVFSLVCLCDIFMPEKEGLQTIRELHGEFGKVKIVAMSGGNHQYGQVDFLPLAKKYGAAAALHKPLAPKALLGAVREVLGA
jgi:DNA-binding NarL/FixJ family response regulator